MPHRGVRQLPTLASRAGRSFPKSRRGPCTARPRSTAVAADPHVVLTASVSSWFHVQAEARSALALLQRVACRRLAACGGYLVELVEGLVLAAFTDPEAAVRCV